MNNQHSAALGRNQENKLLLPIADCRLPIAGVRNWKLRNRKGAALGSRDEFRFSISNRQS